MENRDRTLDENTVIGTAKTSFGGKTVYVDILYGNRVPLPDGTVSRVDPAVYGSLLQAYLDAPGASAPPEQPEHGSDDGGPLFEDPAEKALPRMEEETQEKETDLRSDPSSFFYRAPVGGNEKPSPDMEQARLNADGGDFMPDSLEPGRTPRDVRLLAALMGVIGVLGLLLLLLKLGVL